jgi:hypothetical protein
MIALVYRNNIEIDKIGKKACQVPRFGGALYCSQYARFIVG